MLNPDQVPPAGPTYIYMGKRKEKKRKRKERGELLRSAGKTNTTPPIPQ